MIRSANNLIGYKLGALDGEFGKVRDFYFDDQSWTIRYLVADTGGWLAGLQVLISPFAVKSIVDSIKHINVSLTAEQIAKSPPIDSDKPVSRQFELKYHQHFGWPMYWYGPALWGPGPFPVFQGSIPDDSQPEPESSGNPHLRSIGEVLGYHIRARDHEIGHVHDFLIDDENWSIRYLVVDTRNWWPGKKVLLSPQWIERVSWQEAMVHVDLLRETIKAAPEFARPISREYEESLYRHYEKDPYWSQHPHDHGLGKRATAEKSEAAKN